MPAIAILLTNADPSAFAARHPNDGEKVARLLGAVRPDWRYEVVAAKDGLLPPAPTAFDAYVITGSPASVNDDRLPWLPALEDFVRAVHAARRPLVGLCFGHQLVAKALGGAVQVHPGGWGLGTAPTDWQAREPWMTPWQPRMQLMAAHQEQVHRLPPQARVLGGSDFCPIGAMQVGDHLFTTQFHPEMPLAFMRELLDFLEDKLDAATLARARASLATPDDAPAFARWMVQFIEHAWGHAR